jgi:hypothetical protein
MSDTVISLDDLSKRYRITVGEQPPETVRELLIAAAQSPFKYLREMSRPPTVTPSSTADTIPKIVVSDNIRRLNRRIAFRPSLVIGPSRSASSRKAPQRGLERVLGPPAYRLT